ncbi:aromatic acid/H+ symport family MFS transporter [Pseudonocardia sp. RS11V-5]|uniref:MFS transporter n=1 Tax=Pseudonocardia terrae TaxID=2905831 RepID=UPI001E3AC68C|nr:aromatic acid/H+ symport family MFS transporter [Pseudonocardia terrae]MCE3555807.1 aromatic acid/H+ symport family MFS transporter [Pseudonocardia terrae]
MTHEASPPARSGPPDQTHPEPLVDVTATIDNAPFGRLHLVVVLLCGLTILFDGYDLTIYGAALPRMIEEFQISPAVAGTIGSSALVGMMIGAIACGMLADRHGRKPVIIACVVVYSVFTGAVLFAGGPWELAAYRFIAGLGIGGVMPNAVALVAEFAPRRLRNVLVSVMFSGYMVGGIIASLAAIGLVPAFGWRSLFLVGALPLLLVPLMVRYLPESPVHLLRAGDRPAVARLLCRLVPSQAVEPDSRFVVAQGPPTKQSASPLSSLFRDGRATGTVMLWVAFFMVLLMIYGLSTWLPQLMIKAGYPLGTSLSFLLTLYVAGTAITWVGGYVADRFGARRVLVTAYLVAAVFVAVLGVVGDGSILVVYAAVALGGGATFAAQIFANAYAAQFYPDDARSTGVGWALGVGRIGAILGPTLGGVLLTVQVPLPVNFLAFAVPGLIAALALVAVRSPQKGRLG